MANISLDGLIGRLGEFLALAASPLAGAGGLAAGGGGGRGGGGWGERARGFAACCGPGLAAGVDPLEVAARARGFATRWGVRPGAGSALGGAPSGAQRGMLHCGR